MAAKKKCSEKTIKILKTSALYYSFLALGLCLAIPGPTLLDLQQVVKTDTGKIAFIYLARSGSALVGSLVGGTLFDMIKRGQLLLVGSSLLMSLSTLATPWSRNKDTLIAIWAVGGLGSGALETGLNVSCLNLWGKESAPYYHGLSFMFGLGAFLAPLIAEPFLSTHCHLAMSNKTLMRTAVNETSIMPNVTYSSCNSDSLPPVTYSYSIIGAVALSSTCFSLILALLFPDEHKQPKEQDNKDSKQQNVKHTITIVIMAWILLSLYCGIEIGYAQMLVTFAVKGDLKLSKSTASFITALFWVTFTSFRGFAVFLQSKFSAFNLLLIDLMAVLSSSTMLLLYASKYVEVLWAGTFILAAGLASFYPCVVLWIESYVPINNKLSALFVVSGTFGEMAVPLTVSQFVETRPLMLMFICTGCAVGGSIATFIMWVLMKKKHK